MKFGEQLVGEGAISPEQLSEALTQQCPSGKLLGEVLLDLGYLSEKQFLSFVARQFNTLYVSSEKLLRLQFKPEILKLIPHNLSAEHLLVPIFLGPDGRTLGLVGCEPQNLKGIMEAKVVSGVERIKIFMARRETILTLIQKFYRSEDARDLPGAMTTEASCRDLPLAPDHERPDAREVDFVEVIKVLVNLLEMQVPERAGHSSRVAKRVAAVSERLQLDKQAIGHNIVAAHIHELGGEAPFHLTLIGVTASVENRLLAHRYRLAPATLLAGASLPQEVAHILADRFECYADTERPGLKSGEEIHLGARILAAVDAYEDLIHNPDNLFGRTWRPWQALSLIKKQYGHLFDPVVIGALDELVCEGISRPREDQRSRRILVADPDEATTRVVETVLRQNGYQVEVAGNSQEAMRILMEERLSAVVVDMQLEPDDGFALLKLTNKPGLHLPVIMTASQPLPAYITQAFKDGVADFITKPVRPEILVGRLNKLIQLPLPDSAEGPPGGRISLEEQPDTADDDLLAYTA